MKKSYALTLLFTLVPFETENLIKLGHNPVYLAQGWYLLGGIVCFTLLLLICLVIRSRKKIIGQLRHELVQDLHDEIGASLSNICLLSALVERAIPSGSEEQGRQFLHRISEEATKIHDTISDSITVADPSFERLNELTALLMHHARETFRYQDTSFSIQLPAHLRTIKIHANQRRDFYLILKEGLHNIVRHAEATEAGINFQLDKGRLLCHIYDNGKGFETGQQIQGNGTKNMIRRAKKISGQLTFNSDPGKGTTLEMRLPIHLAFWPTFVWKIRKRKSAACQKIIDVKSAVVPNIYPDKQPSFIENYAKEY